MTVVAAAVLLLNDHVLKQAHPGFVTGKLSDVAGLVAAAPLVALIFLRRADLAATLLTGVLFTLVKTTQTGAETASQVWSLLAGPSRVLADPTDLLALPALALAWWVRRRTLRADSRRWRVLVATPLTVLAVTATAGYIPHVADGVHADDRAIVVYESSPGPDHGTVLGLVSVDGGATWARWQGEPFSAPQTAACVPGEARHCYRVVPGRMAVEQSDDGGRGWHQSWELSEGRRDLLARQYPNLHDAAEPHARGLAVQPRPGGGHVVVVANDVSGIVVRDADGTWRNVGWPDFAKPTAADPVETERNLAYGFALAVLLGALGSGMRRLRVPYQLCAMVASGGLLYIAADSLDDRSGWGAAPGVVVFGGGLAVLATLVCLFLAAAGDTTLTALLIGLGGAVAAYGSVYGPFHGWTVGVPDSYGVAVTAAVVLTLGVLAAMVTLLRWHTRARAATTARAWQGAGAPDYFGGSSTSSPT